MAACVLDRCWRQGKREPEKAARLPYVGVVTRPVLGFGVSRLAGGVAFSLGLILVVVGGAELFTGNNLVAMAWVSRRITRVELCRKLLAGAVRNLCAVTVGNVLGGTVLVAGVYWLAYLRPSAETNSGQVH
jgi:formate/nitrite transporter FocA (FNT family)